MANTSRINGFKPVRALGSGAISGGLAAYAIGATENTVNVFVGDLVTFTGAGANITMTRGAYNGYTLPSVIPSSATTDTYAGVVVGIIPDPDGTGGLSNTYISGAESIDRVILVDSNPETLFEVEADDSGGITVAQIGLNVDPIFGAGNTTSGASGHQVDSSTAATTNTLGLRIVNLSMKADNAAGQYDKVIVKINKHAFANQIAGV